MISADLGDGCGLPAGPGADGQLLHVLAAAGLAGGGAAVGVAVGVAVPRPLQHAVQRPEHDDRHTRREPLPHRVRVAVVWVTINIEVHRHDKQGITRI